MPRVLMTDRLVATARAAARETFFDTKARGLALRVSSAGSKAWYFTYRRAGPTQWVRLGVYPAMPLVEARRVALDHRHAIDVEGRDPAAERRAPEPEAPPVFTFADLARIYETFARGRKKTANEDMQKIRKYLLPAWGALALRSITRAHVHELLDTIAADGLTTGVNRVQAVISRLFTVALDRSLIDAHPAARMIKRFTESASTRTLTDDELRALWTGLEANPGRAADVVWLRLLLGQRGNEVARMRWQDVDLDAALWNLPGAMTKNGRPHTVPLPATALALVKRRRANVTEDEPRVFPQFSLLSDDHRGLAVLHGGAYEWKDLRRTVVTRLAGLGFDETTIGRVVNHARATVTAKHYNQHLYLAEKQSALKAWDEELGRIISGKAKPRAKVVQMKERR